MTTSAQTDGRTAVSTSTYPECRLLQGKELDVAFRRLWETMNAIPEEENQRRLEVVERVAAESLAYQRQQAEAWAGRRSSKPSADGEFVEAFDAALAKAHGLQRMEAARTVAKATARFLCGHIEGTTITRLANIYVRYGSKTARSTGARLARAMAADPHSVRDPLSILEHRCKEATT